MNVDYFYIADSLSIDTLLKQFFAEFGKLSTA